MEISDWTPAAARTAFGKWAAGEGPVDRQWPSLEASRKLIRSFENKPADDVQGLGLAVLKVYLGVSSREEGSLQEGLQDLKNLVSSPEAGQAAALELSWVGCFSESPQLLEASEENLPKSPLAYASLAFRAHRQGDRESGLRYLSSWAGGEISGSGDAASARQAIQEGKPLAAGQLGLLPDFDFGNLHHPRKKYPDSYTYFLEWLERLAALKEERVVGFFDAAVLGFFLGREEDAREHVTTHLEMYPEDENAQSMLAMLEFRGGDPQGARRRLTDVLQREPAHPLACTNLAKLYLEEGNLFRAEPLLQKALTVAPEYPEALCLLGIVQSHDAAKGEEGLEALRRAMSLDPDVGEYHLQYCLALLRTGNVEKLQTEWSFHKKHMLAFSDKGGYRRLFNVALTGSKDPMQDLGVAEMLLKNGLNRAAALFLQRAWKRSYTLNKKNEREFYYYAGMFSAQCGAFGVAAQAYEKLESMEGPGSTATLLLAMSRSDLGEYKKALETLQRVSGPAPGAAALKADVLWKLGRPEEALTEYRSACREDKPGFSALHNSMRCAMLLEDRGAMEELRETGNRLWPGQPQMLALSAQVDLEGGTTDGARHDLEGSLLQGGEFSLPDATPSREWIQPVYTLGCVYLAEGKGKELEKLLSWTEVHLSEGLAEFEVLRAEAALSNGRPEDALAALSPGNNIPPAQATRAACYRELGDPGSEQRVAKALLAARHRLKFYYHPRGSRFLEEWLAKETPAS